MWPNCLNRPIRNARFVDVGDFTSKIGKAIIKHGGKFSKKLALKSAASKTRSKQFATPTNKDSTHVQCLSSESQGSPKTEKGLEMSSVRIYAKGICYIFNLTTYFVLAVCLLVMLLTWVEPSF